MITQRAILADVGVAVPPAPAAGGGTYMPRLIGHGPPEGVEVGYQGDLYMDLDTGTKWGFIGVNGTKIGWT